MPTRESSQCPNIPYLWFIPTHRQSHVLISARDVPYVNIYIDIDNISTQDMSPRSHHGCARCKHRRQKCDEKRPSCSRCIEAAISCEYLITLKWDGRVPRTQERPQRRRRRTTKSSTSASEPRDTRTQCTASGKRHRAQTRLLHSRQSSPIAEATLEFLEIDPYQYLSHRDKLLLDHFIKNVSMLMSHKSIRGQACQILPVALQTPSLMYATLAFSALHLSTLGDPESKNKLIPDSSVTDILANSITHLRHELGTEDAINRPALLHTVKTLCLFEIYSGRNDSSWRAHLKGARALLNASPFGTTSHLSFSGPGAWLLKRWYVSIEALSALTKDETQGEDQRATYPVMDFVIEQGPVLDIYAGYASDLHMAFEDIGCLIRNYASMGNDIHGDGTITHCILTHSDECMELERRVESMIDRDRDGGLQIPIDIHLTPQEFQMFTACNTAYQYSALLHIRRRLHYLGSESEPVQLCVSGILDAVCKVLPVSLLSPWILLTTPIFTAG